MRRLMLAAWLGLFAACPPQATTTPTPPAPPQAFLTVAESNLIGLSITGTVSASGCKTVQGMELLQQGSRVLTVDYQGPNTRFELAASLLVPYYARSGLAVPLTLSSKVVCDDGRVNTSQPVGVTFLPVTSVLDPPGGGQAVPDSFVAEGGLGGAPTTFVGCISTGPSLALARVDTEGAVKAFNETLPFNCTVNSYITDRNRAAQVRWLMEPGVGVFAFDSGLNVTSSFLGKVKQLGVAPDGDALVVVDTASEPVVSRLRAKPANPTQSVVWSQGVSGVANAPPVVDLGLNWAWVAMWQFNNSDTANTVAYKFLWDSGAAVQLTGPMLLVQQRYTGIDQPITPFGSFNADGSLFYLPLLAFDNVSQTVKTAVLACATNAPGCQAGTGARKWTSRFFDGVISTVLPYGGGGNLAAAGSYKTFFLSATTGAIKNLGEAPIAPTGSLITLNLQPGNGAEFYVLNGPVPAPQTQTFPTELVALDSAESGELWRVSFGGGATPAGGLAVAVDEGGQAWLRVGTRLVRPYTNAAYREVRGPSPAP